MTPQEAFQLFAEKHGDLTVTGCIDYQKYYVFIALRDPDQPEFSDPYYAVDKKTGEVGYFAPADLEDWLDACEERSVEWETNK